MGQNSTCKRYSREFKLEAVKMVTSGGYSGPQIAGELGISQKSLYDWKKKLEQQGILAFPGPGRLDLKDAEIRCILALILK